MMKIFKKLSSKFIFKFYKIKFKGNQGYKKDLIYIKGKNNKIYLKNSLNNSVKLLSMGERIKGLELIIRGNNNIIFIEEPLKFIKTKIIITKDNNFLEIKKSKYKIENSIFQISNGNTLKIGEDFSVANRLNIISYGKNKSIEIGEDCMFSGDIWIRNYDGHIIYNKDLEPINPPESIKIGNHVWVGQECFIGKGANIPNNSILGARTLYISKKNFPVSDLGYVFAGSPARIIKENIIWSRKDYGD